MKNVRIITLMALALTVATGCASELRGRGVALSEPRPPAATGDDSPYGTAIAGGQAGVVVADEQDHRHLLANDAKTSADAPRECSPVASGALAADFE